MHTYEVRIDRPQPLGAFALPAGYLLIEGDDAETAAVRSELVAGRVPEHWPARLRALQLAHAGDLDAALAACEPGTPVADFNRFVLSPEGADLAALRAALPAHIAPMVDVVAYALGLVDEAPDPGAAEGEVLALVLAARASQLLDGDDPAGAAVALHEAVAAAEAAVPPLAGVLLGHAATLVHDHDLVGPAGTDPVSALQRAITFLEGSDLAVGRAELHLQLGLMLHEQAAATSVPMDRAIEHYHAALRLVTATSAPEAWAAANLNLGTAYLTMPMVEASDQLRAGIAMQSLRSALEVFRAEEHPAQFATAQLNLANALVYTPSTHQGDNLVEAVERYEEVLALRDRAVDPLGRARVLANQGNALAHLGIFDHAKAKLFEARFLFEEHLDHDAAMAVRSVLDEIAKQTVPDGAPRAGGMPGASDVTAIRAERASALARDAEAPVADPLLDDPVLAAALRADPGMPTIRPPMRVVRLDQGGDT